MSLLNVPGSITLSKMYDVVKRYLECRLKRDYCGFNMLFIGPPGIGKSETVIRAAKDVAEENGLAFWEFENREEPPTELDKTFVLVLFRLDMVKPEDLSGFPRPDPQNKAFDYVLPRWATVLREAKAGLVVLDEFTNINDDTVLSASYDIVLNEKVNLFKFGKPVIALGNPPEVSSLARPLPLPLVNRLAVFNVSTPSVEEWCEYMENKYGDNWAKEVCLYLKAYSKDLLRIPSETEDLNPFPTPRSWSALAVALKTAYSDLWSALKRKPSRGIREIKNLLRSVCAAYVGPEAGSNFINWVTTSVPSPEEIINNPSLIEEFEKSEERDVVIPLILAELAQYDHREWKSRIAKVVDYLVWKNKTRYAAMLFRMMDSKRRKEFITYLRRNKPALLNQIKVKVGGREIFLD